MNTLFVVELEIEPQHHFIIQHTMHAHITFTFTLYRHTSIAATFLPTARVVRHRVRVRVCLRVSDE
jgi:hypothetical protein